MEKILVVGIAFICVCLAWIAIWGGLGIHKRRRTGDDPAPVNTISPKQSAATATVPDKCVHGEDGIYSRKAVVSNDTSHARRHGTADGVGMFF